MDKTNSEHVVMGSIVSKVTSDSMLAVSLTQKTEPLGTVEGSVWRELPVLANALAGIAGFEPGTSEKAATCSHSKRKGSSLTAQLENVADPRMKMSWCE